MDTPLVSVIVTTYNRKELLTETINSILNQTYSNIELIVVDNYSNYDFYDLMNSFNTDKIRAYQNKNNGLIAINRNYGIDKAKGEYVAFSDDDDLWLPNKLKIQIDYITTHDVDFISTGLIYFGEGLKEIYRQRVYLFKSDIFRKNYIATSTVLARKSDILKFDLTPEFNYAEDWACWIKLVINGYKLHQMPDGLVRYRVFPSNTTNQNRIHPNLKGIKILNYMKSNYGQKFKNFDFMVSQCYHCIVYIIKCIISRYNHCRIFSILITIWVNLSF